MRLVIAVPAAPEIVDCSLRLQEVPSRDAFHVTIAEACAHCIPMWIEVLDARVGRAAPAAPAGHFIRKCAHIHWRCNLALFDRQSKRIRPGCLPWVWQRVRVLGETKSPRPSIGTIMI